MKTDTRPTRKDIRRGSVGSKRGWCFEVSYLENGFPNIISALYRTKTEAQQALNVYIENGHLDFYGSAEC